LRLSDWGRTGQGDSIVAMMPFESLRAWQSAHRLALAVYRASETWPRCEIYGLTSQARRAAVSVAANIAEGTAKRGKKEVGRFLEIALGSFSELTRLLRLSLDLGIMASDQWQTSNRSVKKPASCCGAFTDTFGEAPAMIPPAESQHHGSPHVRPLPISGAHCTSFLSLVPSFLVPSFLVPSFPRSSFPRSLVPTPVTPAATPTCAHRARESGGGRHSAWHPARCS
jgi:four helix bundle protein